MSHLCRASKEVLEAVLLYMRHQYEHLSAATSRKLQPRASVSIFTEDKTDVVTWFVRVEASDLGVYFLDGNLFLTKLCDKGGSVSAVLTATPDHTGGRELVVFSRRIGDYLTVQQHIAHLNEDSGGRISSGSVAIEESILPKPHNFPPSGLRVCFQGRCSVESIKNETHQLSTHMQFLHLINPDVELVLVVKVNSENLINRQFPRESGWHPLSTSPYRLITSIQHYTSAYTKQTKLHLSRGTSYTLPPLTLKSGSLLSLKLYCSVAVVPHLSLRRGRKIPANRTCQQLHVLVFGPGSLPVWSDALNGSSLTCLADWESYGLHLQSNTGPEGGVVSSCCCRLNDSRVASNPAHQSARRSRVKCNRSLMIFVFLEDASVTKGAVTHSTTHHWGQQMDCVYELREVLAGLLQSQQKKFKQATHSALNKLLCNYGTTIKTASVMQISLPLLAGAVGSIIRRSSNDDFKRKCRDTLSIQNEDKAVEEYISDRLWEIAEQKLHISKTRTTFPHEPLSPELEHAASENNAPHITSTTNDTPHTTSTTNDTTGSNQTPSSGHVVVSDSHTAPAVQCSDPESDGSQRDREQSVQTTTHPRKYSLFQAMISSKRMKRDVPRQTTSVQPASLGEQGSAESSTTVEQSVEGSSFDELAVLSDELGTQSHEHSSSFPSSATVPDSEYTAIPTFSLNNTSPLIEGHNSCFEDLGVVDTEECTSFEPPPLPSLLHVPTDTRAVVHGESEESMCSTGLCDDDSATEMDGGDETDGEFTDIDDMGGFTSESDSECETALGSQHTMGTQSSEQLERMAEYKEPGDVTIPAGHQESNELSQRVPLPSHGWTAAETEGWSVEQDSEEHNSINFLNPIEIRVSKRVDNDTTPVTTPLQLATSTTTTTVPGTGTADINTMSSTQCVYTTTDSDWVQLGELEDVDTSPQWQSSPVKLTPSQQETMVLTETSSGGYSTTTATVPDITHCSFTDIDEEDFQWN